MDGLFIHLPLYRFFLHKMFKLTSLSFTIWLGKISSNGLLWSWLRSAGYALSQAVLIRVCKWKFMYSLSWKSPCLTGLVGAGIQSSLDGFEGWVWFVKNPNLCSTKNCQFCWGSSAVSVGTSSDVFIFVLKPLVLAHRIAAGNGTNGFIACICWCCSTIQPHSVLAVIRSYGVEISIFLLSLLKSRGGPNISALSANCVAYVQSANLAGILILLDLLIGGKSPAPTLPIFSESESNFQFDACSHYLIWSNFPHQKSTSIAP